MANKTVNLHEATDSNLDIENPWFALSANNISLVAENRGRDYLTVNSRKSIIQICGKEEAPPIQHMVDGWVIVIAKYRRFIETRRIRWNWFISREINKLNRLLLKSLVMVPFGVKFNIFD